MSIGSLTPPFDPDTAAYTVSVEHDVETINVTATLSGSSASMAINGDPSNSGESKPVNLNPAGTATLINIIITAENGTTKTYTITVNRSTAVSPGAPVLLSPTHGEFVVGSTVDLEWEAPAGATHYMVWVFNLSTDQLLYFDMVAGDTSYTVVGLPDNGDFIGWSVAAGDVNTGLWGDFADPRIFQSGTDKAMAPPTLISPADGINIPGTTADFEWDGPEGALAYHIAIINNTTGEFLHFNEILFLGHEKEFTFDGLPDNGDTILWTVVAAIDDGVWSDFAFPRTFVNE